MGRTPLAPVVPGFRLDLLASLPDVVEREAGFPLGENLGLPPLIALNLPWQIPMMTRRRKVSEPEWVRDSLGELIKRSRRTGRPVDLKKFAGDVNLPLRLVRRVYEDIASG